MPRRSRSVAAALLVLALLDLGLGSAGGNSWKRNRVEDKSKCPRVKAMRNLDMSQFVGAWYVVQYYASSEEALSYRCMRAELQLQEQPGAAAAGEAQVSMNFSYSFAEDPLNEQLFGNISWQVPEFAASPAHWLHAELPYEGVYNTYVLDSDYESWALLMHCAEKAGSPRYLSSLIMSRRPSLQSNVVSYLREKLPRYGIDLAYMFPMEQTHCQSLEPFAERRAAAAQPSAVQRPQRPRLRRRHPAPGKS